MALLTRPAYGDVEQPLIDPYGNDSGWSAYVADDGHTGITADLVNGSCVRTHMYKYFYDEPVGGSFTPNEIRFEQREADEDTVSTIKINHETIFNFTEAEWTDYHWEIVGAGAAFNRAATEDSGFKQDNPSSIDPFTIMTWGPAQTGWGDGDHFASLDVCGGIVSEPGLFKPGEAKGGGMLVIDVDLGDPDLHDSDFTLVQYPTPEPGAMALLAFGACALLGRARRNKPDRGGRSRA